MMPNAGPGVGVEVGVGVLVGNGMFEAGTGFLTGALAGDGAGDSVAGPGEFVGATSPAGVFVGISEGGVAVEGTGVDPAPTVHAMPVATTRARPSQMSANFNITALPSWSPATGRFARSRGLRFGRHGGLLR